MRDIEVAAHQEDVRTRLGMTGKELSELATQQHKEAVMTVKLTARLDSV